MGFEFDEATYDSWEDMADELFAHLSRMRSIHIGCFYNVPDKFYLSRNSLEMLRAYVAKRWQYHNATLTEIMEMDPVVYEKIEDSISLTSPKTVKKLLEALPKEQLTLMLTGSDVELRQLAEFELKSRRRVEALDTIY